MANSCKLDSHPLVEEINDWLREGKTYGAIRDAILEQDQEVPERYLISRHESHVNLRPTKLEVKAAVSANTPVPDIRTIAEEALKIFYNRLLTEPEKVSTRELIPLVQIILKEREATIEHSDLSIALSQITDAAQNPQGS